jgi:oxygen-independent coproporphyrinogen-3 oxidase
VKSIQAYIIDAQKLLSESYHRLPPAYFDGKSAGTYVFNNIATVLAQYPLWEGPVDARAELIRQELDRSATATLYLGVPWCEQICSFCNFAYSTSLDAQAHQRYLDRIHAELDVYQQLGVAGKSITGVYFGGGTPTALSPVHLEWYLKGILRCLTLAPNVSVTCESTAALASDEKLSIMRESGVTRLSIGVQSLDDKVRRQARLVGTAEETINALRRCHDRFEMFNVDLIYGHPYQSVEGWCDTVLRTAELGLPSLTLYRMEVKPRTGDIKLFQRDAEGFADERSARLQYFVGRLVLQDAGYSESPLGWWIRREKQTGSQTWQQHMSGWTKAVPYIGLGQGAFSLCAGAYWENKSVLREWEGDIAEGNVPPAAFRALDERVGLLTRLMRVLRTAQYLDVQALEASLAPLGAWNPFLAWVEQQVDTGLFEWDDGRCVLTVAGKSLIHWMLAELAQVIHPAVPR